MEIIKLNPQKNEYMINIKIVKANAIKMYTKSGLDLKSVGGGNQVNRRLERSSGPERKRAWGPLHK